MSGWKQSSRARGANRGGTGGGYEQTDPDWEIKRVRRLRAEYDSLTPDWRAMYLRGLNESDKRAVLNRET
jgi:hypothetical protein